ncbi:NAD(P)H-dependent glycerol-3-phosphate dehydrogenase, partial [Ehrlichia ruminantium]
LHTLIGPSCLGDLILTCTTEHSRNMAFGLEIGKGRNINTLIDHNLKLVEGTSTVKPLISLAKKLNVELPICISIYNLLHENISLDKAILRECSVVHVNIRSPRHDGPINV